MSQDQQQQQKGQQPKASPGISATLPIGLNDLDNANSMSRLSLVSFAIGLGCIAFPWILPAFQKYAFPSGPSTPAIDVSNPKSVADNVLAAGMSASKGVLHNVFNGLDEESQRRFVESMGKKYGLARAVSPEEQQKIEE